VELEGASLAASGNSTTCIFFQDLIQTVHNFVTYVERYGTLLLIAPSKDFEKRLSSGLLKRDLKV